MTASIPKRPGVVCTAWCSSLTSLNAPELHAPNDVREPILLHQAVLKAGPPLEAILVIFGRIFLFESSWKKMKNDTTFVRMRSGDHLGDAKMSKKGTSLRRI